MSKSWFTVVLSLLCCGGISFESDIEESSSHPAATTSPPLQEARAASGLKSSERPRVRLFEVPRFRVHEAAPR